MKFFAKAAVAALVAATVSTAAQAAPVIYGGHQYEFIGQNLTWTQALTAAAAAAPIAGYSAHLVTITSAGEDAFVKALAAPASFVWAAGSDAGLEGTWKWMAGPEAGQTFFVLGGPVVGYSNWNAGEPNNSGTENYLHFRANVGDWNDIYDSFPSGGYVVEYSPTGAVPEPASWAMMIGGFGLVGGTMRYRRRKTSVAYA